MNPNPDKANRLALGLVEQYEISYAEAEAMLVRLTIMIVAGREIATSASTQAALLTAANTAKRCFGGGVGISMPTSVPLKVPWPGCSTLNEAVESLGLKLEEIENPNEVIFIGTPNETAKPEDWQVFCSGWRGGVATIGAGVSFSTSGKVDFALGGVLGGAAVVHHAFVRAIELSPRITHHPYGISLWNPRLNWMQSYSEGPMPSALPSGLWMIGLGHLGQAYLWSLGLLPFRDPQNCEILLQDFDRITEANLGAALLSKADDHVGIHKTRVCADWLRQRGFSTRICERHFDETTRRIGKEPSIALCGLDNYTGRRHLSSAGFSHVIECGLGAGIGDFDKGLLHTFPDEEVLPEDYFISSGLSEQNKKRRSMLEKGEACGALALELSQKAVSTSFVGALASCFVVAELLRMFVGGTRLRTVDLDMRGSKPWGFEKSRTRYDIARIAELGFCYPSFP